MSAIPAKTQHTADDVSGGESRAESRLRILHVLARLDARSGGAAAACLSLCSELARRGHRISIYTTTEGPGEEWREKTEPYGIEVRRFHVVPGSYGFSWGLFRALKHAVRDADVVHVHGIYRFHLVTVAFWCRRYKVPYVVKTMGMLDPFLLQVRRWRKWPAERLLIAPALARATAVQFTAEEEMLLAARSGLFETENDTSISNAIIVPEGIEYDPRSQPSNDTDEFVTKFPETKNKTIVLFLSRLDFKKGLDILAKAFAVVAQQRPDAHLVIAGHDEGYERKVKLCLAEHGMLERTTFTGMLLGTLKSAAYEAASVFVLPSYTENFGMVVCEALSHGLPVVMSDRVNIWREVEEARAGFITKCDPMETAAGMLEILRNPIESKAMGERGRRLVRERFSSEVVVGRILSAYEAMVRGRTKVQTVAG